MQHNHKYWLINKGLGWKFGTNNTTTLAKHAHIKVERHIKVKGTASPYNGNWTYWSQRKGAYPGISQTVGMTLRKQKGKCAEWGLHFHSNDRVEIHHLNGNYRNRRKTWQPFMVTVTTKHTKDKEISQRKSVPMIRVNLERSRMKVSFHVRF